MPDRLDGGVAARELARRVVEIEHRVGMCLDVPPQASRQIARLGGRLPIGEVRGPSDVLASDAREPPDAPIVAGDAVRKTNGKRTRGGDAGRASDVVEQRVGARDLREEVRFGDRLRARVRPRVIADGVPFARDALGDVAHALDVAAEEEERRVYASLREHVEQRAGRRSRPIVERQPSAQNPS